jgi:carbamoyl-phosphate synthase large subunit
MPKRSDIKTILIIGAGPIVIGQACEFDYSGTQGIKALKEEGYRVVLINSNPATIMTDSSLADAVYIEPITPHFIEQIIIKEKPDAILPTLGGQTALNAALKLEELGILAKHNVSLIGVSINAIKKAEDRGLFKEAMERIGLKCPASIIVSSFERGFDNLLYHLAKTYLNNEFNASEVRGVLPILEGEFADIISVYVENAEAKNDFYFKEEITRLEAKNGLCIELPVIIRPSLTLGGTGGGVAETVFEYVRLLKSGLEASPINQIQVDKSIIGWKEFEMEVVRDKNDNAIIVCSIENIDPMGVHTGDSITVAPAITLTDKEYQKMRDYSIAVLREIGVETGGSNVQFAVNPKDGEIVVIEMNPRVSRSSALASKATGFPIAKIAAKLAVGYTLDELKNDIASSIPKEFDYLEYKGVLEGRQKNAKIEEYVRACGASGQSIFDLRQKALPASFEPSLDYIVIKIPKFNFEKFNTLKPELGTQMQSVGEVMAMGRSFEEAILKAISGMEEEALNLSSVSDDEVESYLGGRFPKRLYYIFEGFRRGMSLEEIAKLTSFDPWFLERFKNIIELENEVKASKIADNLLAKLNEFAGRKLQTQEEVRAEMLKEIATFKELAKVITAEMVLKWKQAGFRDGKIRELLGLKAGLQGVHLFKEYRKWLGVSPVFKKIDSCGGEFASTTNYFYSTYERGGANEAVASSKKKVVIIGSGPNRVGQGIEFDYSCVHASLSLREMGIESVMINCNPETVSTDYDTSDRLFFEPLSDEHVMNVIENEAKSGELLGVIIQLGGQTPLKLRQTLKAGGVKILGMEKDAIDLCDDRAEFSKLVAEIGAKEAESFKYQTREELLEIMQKLEYKAIIRPSSVIGGRGMAIIDSASELEYYLANEKTVASGIINPLLENATELDVDVLRDKTGKCFIFGMLEHIEYVGVHSGDSSCSVQPRSLSSKVIEGIEALAVNFAEKLQVLGLINIQVAVKGEEIFVIEVNPRASRTVPFTAKAIGFSAIKLAVKLMCGEEMEACEAFANFSRKIAKNGYYVLQNLGFQAVKEPVFSFEKFLKSDIVRGPEMKSLGEVMGIAKTFGLAYAKALIASGQKFVLSGNAFISVKEADKGAEVISIAKSLINLGFKVLATRGTASFLSENGINCEPVSKVHEGGNHIVKMIDAREVQLVINTTSGFKSLQDSFLIRRGVVRNKILHSTTLEGGRAIVQAILEAQKSNLEIFKTS